MEQEVKDRFESIESLLEKTNIKVDGLEVRVNSTETSIQLINQNIKILIENTSEIKKMIDKNNSEIKSEIKDLVRKREEDHYVKPLQNIDKIKFQVLGILIGIFLSAFLGYIIPNLK